MSTHQKKPVWQPKNELQTAVGKFIEYVNEKQNLQIRNYSDLHNWSVGSDTLQDFWANVYAFFDIAPKKHPFVGKALKNKLVDNTPLYPPPQFFPNAKLNLAEYILRNGKDNDIAIHFVREGVTGVERVTWKNLRNRTRVMRQAMLNHGVQTGDIIGAVISNSVDAMVICLAALSIGAIWSSASCELGAKAIIERFNQVNPKLIFADDAYRYGGKLIPLAENMEKWSNKLGQECNALSNIIVVPYCNIDIQLNKIWHGKMMNDFLHVTQEREMDFEYLPAFHPAFILYSSGTTGTPKCIVHSAGGVLLKVKADSVLQHDMQKTDIAFQYTTTAWVMWVLNFINLSSAGSLFLYDGSPFHPHPEILLKLTEEIGVTIFGTSPRYLSELKARNIRPREIYNLEKLRIVTSTGAVLSADMYHWFYEKAFPKTTQVISMSGGTDIAGSFVGGTPLLPVYAGEIQAKALGMAVEVFSAAESKGVSIESSGNPGELVCTKPFPSQPLMFYGQNGAERYRKSYFERFGNDIWCQGDFIQVEKDTGGIYMLGRSDGVLNPSGVRFGSADIYAVTEEFSEIEDSICVGQRREHDEDERVLLFVKIKGGQTFGSQLVQRIKSAIKQKYSSRHVPKYIFQVQDIPYTVNGKKCEINVKQLVSGQSTAVSGTVANPESLELYKKYLNLPTDEKRQAALQSKL